MENSLNIFLKNKLSKTCSSHFILHLHCLHVLFFKLLIVDGVSLHNYSSVNIA